MLDGKQIRDATITAAKLAAAVLSGYLKADGSVSLTGTLNANNQRITGIATPTQDTDAARLMDLYAIPWKDKVKCATTANITLASIGLVAQDGITLLENERVLVRAQTTQAENGIYAAHATGGWTRVPDADTINELRGAVVTVEQGTVYADHRFAQTTDTGTLGTAAIVWVDIGTGTPAAFDTSLNKGMAASTTTADNQLACATTLAAKPVAVGSASSYVRVAVNGVGVIVGDAVKTKDAYWSRDSGTTALALNALQSGDSLYWVGTVAGYQLAAATDTVDFLYAV